MVYKSVFCMEAELPAISRRGTQRAQEVDPDIVQAHLHHLREVPALRVRHWEYYLDYAAHFQATHSAAEESMPSHARSPALSASRF